MDLYVKGMNLIFLILLIMSTLGLVSFILFFTTCPPKAERLKDNFQDELDEYPYFPYDRNNISENNTSESNTEMNRQKFNLTPNNHSTIQSLHKLINLDDLLR